MILLIKAFHTLLARPAYSRKSVCSTRVDDPRFQTVGWQTLGFSSLRVSSPKTAARIEPPNRKTEECRAREDDHRCRHWLELRVKGKPNQLDRMAERLSHASQAISGSTSSRRQSG